MHFSVFEQINCLSYSRENVLVQEFIYSGKEILQSLLQPVETSHSVYKSPSSFKEEKQHFHEVNKEIGTLQRSGTHKLIQKEAKDSLVRES